MSSFTRKAQQETQAKGSLTFRIVLELLLDMGFDPIFSDSIVFDVEDVEICLCESGYAVLFYPDGRKEGPLYNRTTLINALQNYLEV